MPSPVPQQIADRATDIAYAASAATTGVGLWTWMGKNAEAIGALCAIVGLVLAFVTAGINWYYKHSNAKHVRRN